MKVIFPYILAVFVLGLDQWSKYLVRASMQMGESIPIIDSIFHLTYIVKDLGAYWA